MAIQEHLAYSLDRKDQEPNKNLAERIVNKGGEAQLQELVDFFLTQPHKEFQKDSVLTLAWVSGLCNGVLPSTSRSVPAPTSNRGG